VLDVAGLRHVASGQAGLSPLPRPEPVR